MNAIRETVERLVASGSEVIFLSQNYMNTRISCHLKEDALLRTAGVAMAVQREGKLKRYMTSAAEAAEQAGARICDLYSTWEALDHQGVDTTELLINKINHPDPRLHYYMAMRLIETMFDIR